MHVKRSWNVVEATFIILYAPCISRHDVAASYNNNFTNSCRPSTAENKTVKSVVRGHHTQ